MWVQRSPEEIAQWHQASLREARSHALLIACVVCALGALLVAGGWFVSIRTGFALHRSHPGTTGGRLLIATLVVPFAWLLYRREHRSELAKLTRRTICPTCDTVADGNDGKPCQCGGRFVSASTVKWVEE